MKSFIAGLVCVICIGAASASDVTTGSLEGTYSVLKSPVSSSASQPVPVPTVVAVPAVYTFAPAPVYVASDSKSKVTYKNKQNVAPCAVQKSGSLSYCETCVDACCNRTSQLASVEVPFCAPPCASKDTVSVSRNGRRVVHDYGKYEVVLKSKKDGDVEVDYKKRLFNR